MHMTQKLLRVLLGIVAFATLPACATPVTYSAEPIEAWVVDAETKTPLENVVVVANWALETTSRIVPHQTNAAGSLVILEAVTDKNGRFYLPPWGPKWHLGNGELTDSDPELILFKSGYKYLRISNSQYLRPRKYSDEGKPSGTESKPTGTKRISFWSGERIELKPVTGTMEEYTQNFNSLNRELDAIVSKRPENCEWKKLPRTIMSVKKQRQALEEKGARYPFSIDQRLITSDEYFRTKGGKECGSPKDFIGGLER
jgi:hypothetical protein